MSSTANARFDGLIILPRRPPKSLGPFFAIVIKPQLQLVSSLSFVALFLVASHAFFLLSIQHSTFSLRRMTVHLPEDIHFSKIQFVHDTDLFYDNTQLTLIHSSQKSPSRLKTYLDYSNSHLFVHFQVLPHQQHELLYATCITSHSR